MFSWNTSPDRRGGTIRRIKGGCYYPAHKRSAEVSEGGMMGIYTELVYGARLKKDTPPDVIKKLKDMFDFNKFPTVSGIPFGSSYYFAVSEPCSKFFEDRLGTQCISIRCSIKNYCNEIESFIEWLSPYVDGCGDNRNFLGYMMYEEDEKPTLIWCKSKYG